MPKLKVIAIENSPENFLIADGRQYTVLFSRDDRLTLRCPLTNMTTVVKRSRVLVVK